jgi:hypothetical protein
VDEQVVPYVSKKSIAFIYKDLRFINPNPTKIKATSTFETSGTVFQPHTVTSHMTGIFNYAAVSTSGLVNR